MSCRRTRFERDVDDHASLDVVLCVVLLRHPRSSLLMKTNLKCVVVTANTVA